MENGQEGQISTLIFFPKLIWTFQIQQWMEKFWCQFNKNLYLIAIYSIFVIRISSCIG